VAGRERDGRAIADFLLAEGKVSAAVQAFLRTVSDAQVWRRLIVPIEWDTEAEEAPEVIREIKDRLVVLGEKSGVTPDKADDVAEHSLRHRLRDGNSPERPLFNACGSVAVVSGADACIGTDRNYERSSRRFPTAHGTSRTAAYGTRWQERGDRPSAAFASALLPARVSFG
jgi:hypothetical protein